MGRRIALAEASAATGQPVSRLRWWCATGKLRCDRDGTDWAVPIEELRRIEALVAERDRAIAAGRSEALVVPLENAPSDLSNVVGRRLGLPPGTVTTSKLALDGTEYVLAVWTADASTSPKLVVELVEELGGDVLDGEGRS